MDKKIQVLVGIVMTGLLSGCASSKHAQQLQRLQSQVGLLDERLTQLERSSASTQYDAATATAPAGYQTTTPASVSSQPITPSAEQKWTKPSTKHVQQALANAGLYQGAVDGKKGPLTKKAIKEFQKTHGLRADGMIGKQTWAKLSPYLQGSAESPQQPLTDGTSVLK